MENVEILTLGSSFCFSGVVFVALLAACGVGYLKLRGFENAARAALPMVEGVAKSIDELEDTIKDHEDRLTTVESWIEMREKHIELSAKARTAAEVKAESKIETDEAMEKGRSVILAPVSNEVKKEKLMALVAEYPNVAVSVAKKLNRRFGISRFLGMKEDDFITEVANIAAKYIKPEPKEEGPESVEATTAAPGLLLY